MICRMICPQTNLECQMSVICGDSRGCQVAKRVNTNPPPPTDMAEIERLVDVFGGAAGAAFLTEFHQTTNWRENAEKHKAARAALMEAIRKLAEKKDA